MQDRELQMMIDLGLAALNAAQGLLEIAKNPANHLDKSYQKRAQQIIDKEKASLRSYGVRIRLSRQTGEWEIF